LRRAALTFGALRLSPNAPYELRPETRRDETHPRVIAVGSSADCGEGRGTRLQLDVGDIQNRLGHL
jgi:hypothetical protein